MSSAERLSASDSKATKRPSPEIAGSREAPSPPAPAAPVARLAKVVTFVAASRTKTFVKPLLSSAEMLSASVSKATWSPLAELEEVTAFASTGAPAGPVAREMRIDVVLGRQGLGDNDAPRRRRTARPRRAPLAGVGGALSACGPRNLRGGPEPLEPAEPSAAAAVAAIARTRGAAVRILG